MFQQVAGCLRRRMFAALPLLAALAALPYLPSLGIPLISDDYLVIGLSKGFGPVSKWPSLLADPLYRNRATSILVTYWTYEAFGLSSLAYAVVSLAFHVLNTWLIFAFGGIRQVGYRISFLAAAFFAVYEGHQEAVIWFSALPELLVFFFGLITLLAWLRWLEEGGKRMLAAALTAFLLALLSKESAVAIVPLLAACWAFHREKAKAILWGLAPFALLAMAYTGLAFLEKSGNQHFSDGTFHLAAPFWLTIRNSIGRMLWFWGLLSLIPLSLWRPQHWRIWIGGAMLWMAVTLLPYSFLSYMPRVPSRHTYLPSAGLSALIAYSFYLCYQRAAGNRRWMAYGLAALVVAHNCGYLWLHKHGQYVLRAEPTEVLIEMAKQAEGPIFIESFPYSRNIAEYTVELATGKPRTILLFEPAERPLARHIYSWKNGAPRSGVLDARDSARER